MNHADEIDKMGCSDLHITEAVYNTTFGFGGEVYHETLDNPNEYFVDVAGRVNMANLLTGQPVLEMNTSPLPFQSRRQIVIRPDDFTNAEGRRESPKVHEKYLFPYVATISNEGTVTL